MKFVQWVKVIMGMKMIFIVHLFLHTAGVNKTDSTVKSFDIQESPPH